MSLTSHLDEKASPVRLFMTDRFPNKRSLVADIRHAVADATTIRPIENVPWGLLGHAVDRRIRGYFEPVSFDLMLELAVQKYWGPDDGFLWRHDVGLELERRVVEMNSVGKRLDQTQEEWLGRLCLALSLFEVVYRSGIVPAELEPLRSKLATADEILAIPQQTWVDDLCAMSWAFYENHAEMIARPTILNPTFDGSGDVEGADADLIVDGCLLEVKATVNPHTVRPEWLYQLLGYALLDYSNKYHIESVGFYFARQSRLICWPLDKFIDALTDGVSPSLSQLRAEFAATAGASPKAG